MKGTWKGKARGGNDKHKGKAMQCNDNDMQGNGREGKERNRKCQ